LVGVGLGEGGETEQDRVAVGEELKLWVTVGKGVEVGLRESDEVGERLCDEDADVVVE
jgi:hypothetical protein